MIYRLEMDIALFINPRVLVKIIKSWPDDLREFSWFLKALHLLHKLWPRQDWNVSVSVKKLKGQYQFLKGAAFLSCLCFHALINSKLDKLPQLPPILAEISKAVSVGMENETCLIGEDEVSSAILVSQCALDAKSLHHTLILRRLLLSLHDA